MLPPGPKTVLFDLTHRDQRAHSEGCSMRPCILGQGPLVSHDEKHWQTHRPAQCKAWELPSMPRPQDSGVPSDISNFTSRTWAGFWSVFSFSYFQIKEADPRQLNNGKFYRKFDGRFSSIFTKMLTTSWVFNFFQIPPKVKPVWFLGISFVV